MIRTARLTLRPFRADDLEPLHAIFSDSRAMRYWDRPAWENRALTQRMLEMFMRDAPSEHLEFAVDLNGNLIGRVGMWQRHEIGYILHPDHWGRGYATEAMRALIAQVWKRFDDAPCITAEADPRNTASAKLLRKLGFAQTGFAEKNFDYGGIEICDTAYFTLARA